MANTPDRWQALRSVVAREGLIFAAHTQTVNDLLAERDALAKECNALREALRFASSLEQASDSGRYSRGCTQCGGWWTHPGPENHAADCLAQLKE